MLICQSQTGRVWDWRFLRRCSNALVCCGCFICFDTKTTSDDCQVDQRYVACFRGPQAFGWGYWMDLQEDTGWLCWNYFHERSARDIFSSHWAGTQAVIFFYIFWAICRTKTPRESWHSWAEILSCRYKAQVSDPCLVYDIAIWCSANRFQFMLANHTNAATNLLMSLHQLEVTKQEKLWEPCMQEFSRCSGYFVGVHNPWV